MQPTARLYEVVDKLSGRDREFASSLLDQERRGRRLSTKQLYWVTKLVEKAEAGSTAPAPVAKVAGSLTAIVSLFEKAAEHLQYPKIILHDEVVGTIRLWVAGEKSKEPGSVSIVTDGRYGERDWIGRVSKTGEFTPSPRLRSDGDALTSLTALLTRFAADPAHEAAEYGRLTGQCCFCARRLDDERSTSVGYGPICASNYGLAWG